MKTENSRFRSLKYRHRFFFTLDYLLKKIGVNFTRAYIYSIKLDDFVFEEAKSDGVIIKESSMEDLPKFGELSDLFLQDMQNGHVLVAAFSGDEWVGYNWISLKPIEVEEVERDIHFTGAYLWRGYIKKGYRQRGIFKKLLHYSLYQVKNKYKRNEVYGIIETANIPSIKGVERLKFSRVGTINYFRFFLWKKYEEKIENNTVTLLEN